MELTYGLMIEQLYNDKYTFTRFLLSMKIQLS